MTTRRTSRLLCGLCATLAMTVAGGAYALDQVGLMRVADYTTAPANNSAPGMPGRADTTTDNRSTGETMKEKVSDTTITTKVKAKLLGTKDLKSTGIHVKTRDGVVDLTGSVPSTAQKQTAVDVVRSVDGVVSVNNELKTGG